MVEVCARLDTGDRIGWRFSAARPADFNIHYHEGKEVHYPERREATSSGEGLFAPSLKQHYGWMLEKPH